jgi:hypothetical protein
MRTAYNTPHSVLVNSGSIQFMDITFGGVEWVRSLRFNMQYLYGSLGTGILFDWLPSQVRR